MVFVEGDSKVWLNLHRQYLYIDIILYYIDIDNYNKSLMLMINSNKHNHYIMYN